MKNLKKPVSMFLSSVMVLGLLPLGTLVHAAESAYAVLAQPSILGGVEDATYQNVAAVWESVYYNAATGTTRIPTVVESEQETGTDIAREDEFWHPMRLMSVNTDGVYAITGWYQNITGLSSSGYAAAQDFNGKWGVINAEGRTIIDFTYSDMTAPSDSGYVAANQFSDAPVLVNLNEGSVGNEISLVKSSWTPPAENIGYAPAALYTNFDDGMIGVLTQDTKWQYYNLSNGSALSDTWALTSGFHNGYAIVVTGNSTQVIDSTGTPHLIDDTGRYGISCADGNMVSEEGLVSVYDYSLKRSGYLNMNGDIVIPFVYAGSCRAFHSGYAAVAIDVSNGDAWNYGWDLIDTAGNRVMNREVVRVSDVSNTGVFWVSDREGVITSVYQMGEIMLAYASTQSVDVDGVSTEFQMYALKNAEGNLTNYVKARDVADILDGSAAQFNVEWNGAVNLVSKTPYTSRNGTEGKTPYIGDRAYVRPTDPTNVNGVPADLDAIRLTDEDGNGYTYYKLRDLGKALGFNVGWSAEKGVFIDTNNPYAE